LSADSREAIEAALLAWMAEPARPDHWPPDEARFERLALALFAFQYAHCAPYRRFCRGRGAGPDTVTRWQDVPPVPTGAFKEVPLRCFDASRVRHRFRTSGTATERRGELALDTLALYEASLEPGFRLHLLPDLPGPDARVELHALAPPPSEAPDSSLSHMFGVMMRRVGTPESGFHLRQGRLDAAALLEQLGAASGRTAPLLLCGTAFAFVHLLEWMESAGRRLALPAGARVMETGGFKGRSRTLDRPALHAWIGDRLGVPEQRIVNQYGMTELGSQFHDSVLRLPGSPRRKLGPPWTRVRVVDPTSGASVAPGDVGAIRIHDLANTGSVAAVQTADLGRVVADGFEVLGRAPGAEARGCSLAVEEMLERDAS